MANNWTLSTKRLFVKQVDEGKTPEWQSWYWNIGRSSVMEKRKYFRSWLEEYDARFPIANDAVHPSEEVSNG